MPTTERDDTVALVAAVIGGAALCYGFMALKLSQSLLGPMLFALPLALTLLALGRLRWTGALYLALAVAGAYYLAVLASILTYSKLNESIWTICTEADSACTARTIMHEQIIGAVGGVTGAFVSFLAITPFGPKFRDRRALTLFAIALPVFVLIGAFGFSSAPFGAHERLLEPGEPYASYLQGFYLFALWQLVFGAVLIMLLRHHTPRERVKA